MTVTETRHGGAELTINHMVDPYDSRTPTIAFGQYLEVVATDTITAIRQGDTTAIGTQLQSTDALARRITINQPSLQTLTRFIKAVDEEVVTPPTTPTISTYDQLKESLEQTQKQVEQILSPQHADQAHTTYHALTQRFANLLVRESPTIFTQHADQFVLKMMQHTAEDFPQTAPQFRRLRQLATVVEGFNHANQPVARH